MHRIKLSLLTLFTFCLGICAQIGCAQASSDAQISGIVSDPSGAVLANVQITASQSETNSKRTTLTAADGSYILLDLPLGHYQILAVALGFERCMQRDIQLQISEHRQINLTMQVGKPNETLQVFADALQVQPDRFSIHQVMDQQRMVEMPLNGRQPLQLLLLSGSANDSGPANGMSDLASSKNYASADTVSVAGGQANGINYLLDGAENMDTFSNVNLPLPFPDALQEFSVDSSSLSARYGLHPGAVVNVATRSGTNQIHGSLFEFLRNGALNAIDYFATKQDSLKRNQFGGTLGAPVLRNHLFGFFGIQQTIVRTAPPSTFSWVPTQAALQGDFSTLAGSSCQSSGVGQSLRDPQTGALFPNNQISPSRFNAAALSLLHFMPVATDPCGKITFAISQPQSERQILGRMDANIQQRHMIFGHFYQANYSSPGPYDPSNVLLSQARGVNDASISAVLGHTWALRQDVANVIHLGYTRMIIHRGSSPQGFNYRRIGVNLPYQPISNSMYIVVPGYFQVGCKTCGNADLGQNNLQLSDDYDQLIGHHHLSLGLEWLNQRYIYRNAHLANGTFTFSGQSTQNALADFLLGLTSQFQQGNIVSFDGRQNYFAAYLQDLVRLGRHWTVHAGIRWEPALWGSEGNQRMQHFSPEGFSANAISKVFVNAPPGEIFVGDTGMSNGFTSDRYLKIEPRLGISLDPEGKGKQVLHLGYGLFYDTLALGYWEDQTSGAPWGYSITLSTPVGGFADPYKNYPGGNPFPTQTPPPSTIPFPFGGTYYSYPLAMRQSYVHEWNLGYELQMGQNWLLTATYLGSATRHILSAQDKNSGVYLPGQCNGNPCSTPANLPARRVLALQNPVTGAYYSDIFVANDGGNASYHGLLVKAERPFRRQYTVLANFTWSHCISDADFEGDLNGSSTQDPNNLRAERGNCGFDIRRMLNLSLVAESSMHRGSPLLRQLTDHWKIAPLLSWRTGTWFTPWTGSNNSMTGIYNAMTGGFLDRPNLVGNPYLRRMATRQWLNPASFQPNPIGTFGTAGSDSLQAPGYVNLDIACSKQFILHQQQRLELRFESFNALNHPNFAPPDPVLANATFGKLQKDISPRLLQFAAKVYF